MSKFSVGELALVVGGEADKFLNTVVTIIAIGPFPSYQGPADYRIKFADGAERLWDECFLRKLPGDSKEDFIPPAVRKLFNPNKERENA